MKKENLKYFKKFLLVHVLLWIALGMAVILITKAETSKVFISDLPNIENDFFNNFIVNGVDISRQAALNTKGILFGFVSNNPGVGYGIFAGITIVFGVTTLGPLFSLWGDFLGRGWFVFVSYINLILIVFLIVGFSWPLNPDNFYSSFDKQIYQSFENDFFNTPLLQEQLEILRTAIKNNFNFTFYSTINVIGLITVIAGFGATIWWQIADRKFILNNNSETEVTNEPVV